MSGGDRCMTTLLASAKMDPLLVSVVNISYTSCRTICGITQIRSYKNTFYVTQLTIRLWKSCYQSLSCFKLKCISAFGVLENLLKYQRLLSRILKEFLVKSILEILIRVQC